MLDSHTSGISAASGTPRSEDREQLVGAGRAAEHLPLRGRAGPLALLQQTFGRVQTAGRSQTVVITGAPGIGKTRLLRSALEAAEERGMRQVVFAADRASQNTPAGTLIQGARVARPPLLATAELPEHRSSADALYWLTARTADALERAAKPAGVLIVVDDAHWLDPATASVLTTLIQDLDDLPLCWVIAARTEDYRAEAGRFLHAAAAHGSVLQIGPLDDEAVEQVSIDILGRKPGPNIRSALQRTDRVPLLLVELLRGLRDEPATLTTRRSVIDVTAGEVPRRYGASARVRIEHLSPRARRLAQSGSLLGRQFRLPDALEMLEIPAHDAAAALDELLHEQIVTDNGETLAFTHDTVREALETSITPSLRQLMSRTAIRLRLRAGETPAAVSAALLDTAKPGDEEAFQLLTEAAQTLAATDATGAAELAEKAVQLADDDPRFDARLLELIPMLWNGGKASLTRTLLHRIEPSLSPEERANSALVMARLLTNASFDEALQVCAAALALPDVSTTTRVRLLALQALNSANIGADALLQQSLHDARRIADPHINAFALATIDACESVSVFHQMRFAEAEQLISTALQRVRSAGTDPNQWLPEGLWLSFVTNSRGNPVEALRMADYGLRQAERASNAPAVAYWMMARARYLFDAGALDDAAVQAEAVLGLADSLGLGDFASATAGVTLFLVGLERGDRATSERMLPAMQAMADGTALTRAGSWALARAAWDAGDVAAARSLSQPALNSLHAPVASMTTPPDFSDDILLAAICYTAGEPDRVATVADVALQRHRLNPTDVLAHAVHTAVHGIATHDADQIITACGMLRTLHRPLVLAQTLEIAAGFRQGGDRIPLWEEAADIYERLDATRSAARTQRLLRQAGVHRRGKTQADPSGLSARERSVVERIVAGATTRQIADDLLLSPHTVVTHIRHVYAKLGVRSRKELVQAITEDQGM